MVKEYVMYEKGKKLFKDEPRTRKYKKKNVPKLKYIESKDIKSGFKTKTDRDRRKKAYVTGAKKENPRLKKEWISRRFDEMSLRGWKPGDAKGGHSTAKSKGGMVRGYSTGGSVSRGQYPSQARKVKFKGVF